MALMKPGVGGATQIEVWIDGISGVTAQTHDRFGRRYDVRLDIKRAKGLDPIPGELWIIDRTLGFWSFCAFMGSATQDNTTVDKPMTNDQITTSISTSVDQSTAAVAADFNHAFLFGG